MKRNPKWKITTVRKNKMNTYYIDDSSSLALWIARKNGLFAMVSEMFLFAGTLFLPLMAEHYEALSGKMTSTVTANSNAVISHWIKFYSFIILVIVHSSIVIVNMNKIGLKSYLYWFAISDESSFQFKT